MRQEELFTLEAEPRANDAVIPGFHLERDYVDVAEERELLSHIDAGPWATDWRRRIQQYGLGYGSSISGKPTWVRDFPDWLLPLANRVARHEHFLHFPENCVINEYVPPQGIGPHTDYGDFGPAVACVSLGSDIVMDFRNPEFGSRVPVVVPARSLWVIAGEARWKWTHGIAPRLTDVIEGERRPRSRRVSITFRTARDTLPGHGD